MANSGNKAGQFTRANSEYLSIADNASLSTGDIDYCVAGWFYLDSKPASFVSLVTKYDADGGTKEWYLGYRNTEDRFLFGNYTSTPSLIAEIDADNLGSPQTARWYFIVAWHDATANTNNIQVNNGAINSVTTGGAAPADTTASFRIGHSDTAQSYAFDGRIQSVGFWKKVLTTAEKDFLYNNGLGRRYEDIPQANSLITNMQSWWDLGEASGTRVDSKGTNDLTDNNTVTQATGVTGDLLYKAAQFTAANSEYLTVADNADMSLGADTDFTLCAWFYLDSKSTHRAGIEKASGSGTFGYEYSFFYNVTNDRFKFGLDNNVDTSGTALANTLGSPSTGVWYFVVGWHDGVGNTVNISVNGGPVDSAAYSAGTFNGTNPFEIGRSDKAATPLYMDGRIAGVGFWKKVLTAAERSSLYNNGRGMRHADLSGSLLTSLIAYFDLNESSGPRNDRVGTNHLTDTNTVTQNPGPIPIIGDSPNAHRNAGLMR